MADHRLRCALSLFAAALIQISRRCIFAGLVIVLFAFWARCFRVIAHTALGFASALLGQATIETGLFARRHGFDLGKFTLVRHQRQKDGTIKPYRRFAVDINCCL